MTPREMYHIARRASVTAGKPRTYRHCGEVRPIPRSREVTASRIVAAVKTAHSLPRGSSGLLTRMAAAAVAASRAPAAAAPSLVERGRTRFADLVKVEALRRGLAVEVDLARNGSRPVRYVSETRTDADDQVMLLKADGWADYGRRAINRAKALAILGGRDDAGLWAVRVPATLATAEEALAWLMPAEVRAARDAGKRVLRQGDIWIVERSRDAMGGVRLPLRHDWDSEARVLRHSGHTPVEVPFPATAIAQRTLEARGSGRRGGD